MSTGPDQKRVFWSSPTGLALGVFLFIVGVLLWLEHRAHILGALPLLLPLLICVGMHFFLHGRHNGHGSHGDQSQKGDRDAQ